MRRCIVSAFVALVLGLASTAAPAAWALCAGGFNTATATTTASVNLTVAAGETVIIGIVIFDATATVSSLTIAGESDPTALGTLTRGSAGISNASVQLFVLDHAATSGSKLITLTASSAVFVSVGARCYSGGRTGTVADPGVVAGAQATSVSLTTSVAGDLIVSVTVCAGGNAPTAGFTQDVFHHDVEDDQMFYLTSLDAGAPGSKTADFTGTGSAVMQAAAFMPAAASATGTHRALTGAGA